MGTQAAFVATVFAGAAYLKSPQGQAKTNQVIRKVKSQANSILLKRTKKFSNKYVDEEVIIV